MSRYTLMLPGFHLHLFDGEAAAGAGAVAAGDTSGSSATTQPGTSGAAPAPTVLYGKQDAINGSAAGSDSGGQQPSMEDLRREYSELTKGKYKDVYTEDTQRLINRRFKETKGLEKELRSHQSVLDKLYARHGVDNIKDLEAAIDSDRAYIEYAAEEAGLTPEQYTQRVNERAEMMALRRDNQRWQAEYQQRAQDMQVQRWQQDAARMAEKYPGFNLATELQDQQFCSMLQCNVPLEAAYRALHHDDIVQGVVADTRRQTEKQITDSIAAVGSRPRENGSSSSSAYTIKADPAKWTAKDYREVIKQVAGGATIKL